MNTLWNYKSDKVVVTTYKVVTVLEATFDLSVRNKRKSDTLEQYSRLIAQEDPIVEKVDNQKEEEKNVEDTSGEKHEKKKRRKKKHKDKKED